MFEAVAVASAMTLASGRDPPLLAVATTRAHLPVLARGATADRMRLTVRILTNSLREISWRLPSLPTFCWNLLLGAKPGLPPGRPPNHPSPNTPVLSFSNLPSCWLAVFIEESRPAGRARPRHQPSASSQQGARRHPAPPPPVRDRITRREVQPRNKHPQRPAGHTASCQDGGSIYNRHAAHSSTAIYADRDGQPRN